MKMRFWIPLAFAALALTPAHADEVTVTIPKYSVKTGLAIDVGSNAKILNLKVAGASDAKLGLFLKDGDDFDTAKGLGPQAAYFSNNNGGDASLAIGTYAKPALHAGTWYVAIANYSQTKAVTVTLTTSVSTTAKVPADFQINFSAAPKALETAFGGADSLDCDVDPWTDAKEITVNGSTTTLGEFRQSLLKSTLTELSTQVHSPVPVHIQACWKDFDDSGEHAGAYTLAAAQGTYLFRGDAGMPLQDTWYAMAPAERLAGRRACKYYSDVDCAIPDIVVWYNSADIAKGNYDGPEDEALIRSVTMHEITHGLGFLSLLGVSEKNDDGSDNPDFLLLNGGYADAYTANVGFLSAPPLSSKYRTIALHNLSKDSRKKALTSDSHLVWMDQALADNTQNVLKSRPAPENLVELHAPSNIQPGSTLSHLSSVHSGQLMTAVIQGNFPQTLGLAGPMLARAGWNTSPLDLASPYDNPVPGSWYDIDHSGHGIEMEPTVRESAGTLYSIIFFTFDSAGNPEFFVAPSRLKDGHMGSFDDPSQPAAIYRPIYDPAQHKAVTPDGEVGTLAIDFTPTATQSAACAGHTETQLAVMHWSLGTESGTWCISPALGMVRRPSPGSDLNGLWNAGSSDSGWGFATIETSDEQGTNLNNGLFYFYDKNNQPRWAATDPGKNSDNVYAVHGYCRTCEKEPVSLQTVGTVNFGLTSPEHVDLPSGDNTISIDINDGEFKRTNTAVRMLSLPSE